MSSHGYAGVVVDMPGPVGDRVFYYGISSHTRGSVRPGDQVQVPFQNRWVTAYVVEVRQDVELSRVKEIKQVVMPRLLDEQLLRLSSWMALRYNCTLMDALRCFLPPGYPRGVQRKTRSWVILSSIGKEAGEQSEALSDNAPKQKAIWEYLISRGGEALLAEVLRDCDCSRAPVEGLQARGLARLEPRPSKPFIPDDVSHFLYSEPQFLTPHQKVVLEALYGGLNQGAGTYLLHGVAASGKTEVYLQLTANILARGKSVLALVPEIALTAQHEARFRQRFGTQVFLWHSRLSEGERQHIWWLLREGKPLVIIGARSAVFLPAPNLGAIILDEEHESAYKQDENPRYHAGEVARHRARLQDAVAILGSATPAVATYARARWGEYQLLRLPLRATGKASRISVVDMRQELTPGNWSLISRDLARALEEVSAKGQQALLFLNRRGFATFVLCRSCGCVLECPHCDVSLTYHRSNQQLRCHYCQHGEVVPANCPRCGSSSIRHFGAGTQRVQTELQQRFPHLASLILDTDAVTRQGRMGEILASFARGQAQVLIGTQMVAKGLDLPGIGLAGIIDADTALNLPDYQGPERTYQLLSQVAGRAGRGRKPGRVVVQSYNPGHYSIQAALAGDYLAFWRQEMELRRRHGYPPWGELLALLVSGPREDAVGFWARSLAERLDREIAGEVQVYPAGPAVISRLRGRYRYQVFVKGKRLHQLGEYWRTLRRETEPLMRRDQVGLVFDFHPMLPG